MRAVRALVVAVNKPGYGPGVTKEQALAASSDTWEVTVTWMSKAYTFQDRNTGEPISIKPKKHKRKVFTNYLPALHSWIEVKFL